MGDKQITDIVYDTFVFSLWAVSSSTNVETEVLVYPWTSLVAEFGGTLGKNINTYLESSIQIHHQMQYSFHPVKACSLASPS